ncbi:MAG: exodeoxyribonuclease large subunit [Deferribacteraceae bacterium]|jgi:exodeoxyribonuclease VII large subunit|nr:exodeoxyribonuclease large subunit [Deferribacteraceae bacterium]
MKLTVTEITKKIKFLLESNFNSPVCVVGEISNLSVSPSGHVYFTLKDESAQIKVVFFKRYRMANTYKLNQGDKVEVIGDLSVYESDGLYQIIARKVVYDSAGDFYKRFEETKRILEKEGLFDKDKKKDIPLIVKNVAVLTSPTGAAIKDFIQTLKLNGVGLNIDIWPAQVQGAQAIKDIISKMQLLDRYASIYDVVILMRGGGSLEDLIIFNDETLAREFFKLKIPTISAIGHERDFSICDFVADLRVSTPTAAAETLSKPYLELRNRIRDNINKIIRMSQIKLDKNYQLLDKFLSLVSYKNPKNIIKNKKEILDKYLSDITSSIGLKIKNKYLILNEKSYIVEKKNPINIVNELKSKVRHIDSLLSSSINNKIEKCKFSLDILNQKLKLLNPENILERGYSIVYKNKIPVGSLNNVNLEDYLEIQFKDGYTSVFVTGKKVKKD